MNSHQVMGLIPRIEVSYASAAQILESARRSILSGEQTSDPSDRAKALWDRHLLVESIVSAHERMERILAARRRIEQGTFGICVDCGEDISEARLRAVPWSERCLGCQAAEDGRLT